MTDEKIRVNLVYIGPWTGQLWCFGINSGDGDFMWVYGGHVSN